MHSGFGASHQRWLHGRSRDLVCLDTEPFEQHGSEDRNAERFEVVSDRSNQNGLLSLRVCSHVFVYLSRARLRQFSQASVW